MWVDRGKRGRARGRHGVAWCFCVGARHALKCIFAQALAFPLGHKKAMFRALSACVLFAAAAQAQLPADLAALQVSPIHDYGLSCGGLSCGSYHYTCSPYVVWPGSLLATHVPVCVDVLACVCRRLCACAWETVPSWWIRSQLLYSFPGNVQQGLDQRRVLHSNCRRHRTACHHVSERQSHLNVSSLS